MTAPRPARRSCGTMPVHRALLATSAEYRAARAAIEAQTAEFGRGLRRFPGIARIPVVVHVVWNTPEQDVPDEQVRSQIGVLNRDFRAANPDIASVPEPFRPLVADARVEFALASTDPAGASTSGITRTRTDVAVFELDDAVKSAARGGADPWPADTYLNIWVCPALVGPQGEGILGYAQFPGGPPATDGVVVIHSAFGTTGTAAAPFDLGRTATHEVGHYLNLFHIWGDDDTGCDGTDEVDDTPNQAGPNFGRPTFPTITCDNGPNGDLFVDYMDYVDDAVMVMFSGGQAQRMEACLDGVRRSLVQAVPEAQLLQGRWGHSFEEDREGVLVYRPAGFAFPLARGRAGLELRADGTAVDVGIGRGDAPAARPGRYAYRDGVLTLRTERGDRTLRVVRAEPDRLELRPE